MYNREQVEEATLKYFHGDDLATRVWIDKYCLKNRGEYFELTPDDMHRRLSGEFARIENKYPEAMNEEEIYQLLREFKYIVPQGSPMAGIGNIFAKTSISNCFVVGGHVDSYGGILKADQEQAQLMKRRGGVGQDISWIRPSGAIAGTTPLGPNAGTTLYMERFSNTTREVQQDGRRGALMLSIDVKHPDAEAFIDKKMTEGSVTGANVSVKITDDFMKAYEAGEPFYQTFPIHHPINVVRQLQEQFIEFDVLYNGRKVDGVDTYYKKIDPKKIFDKLIHNAWASAEPGCLFWDRILNESPAKGYGKDWKEVSTNPCGEIPLPPDDSCRLLLLNLYSYLYKGFTTNAMLEDSLLVDHVKKAQRLMDDIVDLEIEKVDAIIEGIEEKIHHPEFQAVELALWKRIKQKAIDGRRTGLGITGEADLIAGLGITYGTPEATKFSESLHQLIATASYESSLELAEERGAFPMYDPIKDKESDFIKRMFDENELMTEDMRERSWVFGRRNIGNLTIAPAGSVSICTQTSSGVEPIFSPYYFRKKKVASEKDAVDFIDEVGDKWTEFTVFHRPFIKWYSIRMQIDMIMAEYQLGNLSKEELDKLFEVSPYYKATAQDVDYVEKVRMQGAIQKWVDHSISVTVNMPENVTEDIVRDVYMEAYKSGCKGITVYRDNSRGNVLSTSSVVNKEDNYWQSVDAEKRPKELPCDIFFKSAKKEPYIILVGLKAERPYEVFAIPEALLEFKMSRTHKTGSIVKLRKGRYDLVGEGGIVLVEDITSYMIESEQNTTRLISALLRHRMDPFYVAGQIEQFAIINSFHKVVGRCLHTYVEERFKNSCSECGGQIIMTDGCEKCVDCGNAKCG